MRAVKLQAATAAALVVLAIVALAGASQTAASGCTAPGPAGPVGGVPAQLVPLYVGAASKYGLGTLGPSILAAINYVETTFGTNLSISSAGAVGWMQFEPGTWQKYRVTPDGSAAPDDPSGWDNPGDAIYTAANYLHASGAPGNWQQAVFAYNHSQAYVDQVMGLAQKYYTQGVKGSGKPTTAGSPTAPVTTSCGIVPLSNAGLVFPFPKNAPGVAPVAAWTLDQGVDISAPGGTPELAMAAGTIVQEGIGGFGPNAPILKLDQPVQVQGQTIAFLYYGHAGQDLVPVGTHVTAGQQISIVGYGIVGISTGPHIEFGGMPTQAIPAMNQTSPAVKQMLLAACGNSCP